MKKIFINLRFKLRILAQQIQNGLNYFVILESFLRSRERISFNNGLLYEAKSYKELCSFIKNLSQSSVSFTEIFENKLPKSQKRLGCFVLRHDIDSGYCEQVEEMLCIEKSVGLRSSVHLFVDNKIYKRDNFRAIVNEYKFTNNFGLHTSQWCISPKPITSILDECSTFEDTFGFTPESISFHGLVPRPKISITHRRNLIVSWNKMAKVKNKPPIQFGFAWTCQDSGLSDRRSLPLVSSNRLEKAIHLGTFGNILIHDTYWKVT